MTTNNVPKRAADGRWLTSGNPAGRPKRVEQIAELAQQHAPDALAKLAALISHTDPKVALAASNAILDRAFGKPFVSVAAQVEKLDIGRLWIEAMKLTNASPPTKTIEGETDPVRTRIVEGKSTPIADDTPSLPLPKQGKGQTALSAAASKNEGDADAVLTDDDESERTLTRTQ